MGTVPYRQSTWARDPGSFRESEARQNMEPNNGHWHCTLCRTEIHAPADAQPVTCARNTGR